jgi:hypothetical protein
VAGDWIKLRTDLQDDQEVLRLSAMLQLDRFSIVGRLAALWAWADKHTINGNAHVTPLLLDDIVSHKGFADAMTVVGWLEVTEKGVRFPKFDRHNGKSAKKRALTARRVVTHRKRKGNASVVTSALTREEKSIKEKQGEPPPDGGPVWGDSLTILQAHGVQPAAARGFLGLLCRDYDEGEIVEAVKASVGKVNATAYIRGVLRTRPKKGEAEKRRLAI